MSNINVHQTLSWLTEQLFHIKEHFLSPTPYLVLLSSLCWCFFYLIYSPKVFRILLPRLTYERLLRECKEKKDLHTQCCINTTALVHALIVTTAAFSILYFSDSVRQDPLHAQPMTFRIVGLIMCGYFIWDSCICLKYRHMYGTTFVLHGLISLFGLYYQLNKTHYIFTKHLLIFMGTELSTPLLHFRWFLTSAKQTGTKLFKLVNISFLLCFVLYRLYFCVSFAIVPFLKLAFVDHVGRAISINQRVFMSCNCLLWMFLNMYWGLLLFQTQCRHLFYKHSSK